MIDDDTTLINTEYNQEKDVVKKLSVPITDKDFYSFIEYSNDLLNTYQHGMVSRLVFPIGIKSYPYVVNKWTGAGGGNTFLDLETLNPDDLGYAKIECAEDMYAFLSIIKRGFKSFVLSKWATKAPAPGKSGGITDVRTVNKVNDAMIFVHSEFPEYTTLKTGFKYGGMTENPLTCRISIK
jgi:hypothetical protein